jgi:ABC-type glutathione transport system ATPase component
MTKSFFFLNSGRNVVGSVSLARAVYSRASILLLDDVLSAGKSLISQTLSYINARLVDAHTAHHLYHECIKGELMRGRTVILISHHVTLCAPGADYVVALDNGRVGFQGSRDAFLKSPVMTSLVTSDLKDEETVDEGCAVADIENEKQDSSHTSALSEPTDTAMATSVATKKPARVLVVEEKRAVGWVQRAVWESYFHACGDRRYWVATGTVLVLVALVPIAQNKWLE